MALPLEGKPSLSRCRATGGRCNHLGSLPDIQLLHAQGQGASQGLPCRAQRLSQECFLQRADTASSHSPAQQQTQLKPGWAVRLYLPNCGHGLRQESRKPDDKVESRKPDHLLDDSDLRVVNAAAQRQRSGSRAQGSKRRMPAWLACVIASRLT